MEIPANQMEMSQKLFLKDISIGSKPPSLSLSLHSQFVPHKKWPVTPRVLGSPSLSPCLQWETWKTCPLWLCFNPCRLFRKSLFPFLLAEAKRALPQALPSVGAVLQEGFTTVGQHTTAQLGLCCSSGAGLHSLYRTLKRRKSFD